MSGYYYKLRDRADERLRIGATAMYWHYARDLGDYSLGQGGYYSPQRWYSLGAPVSYAWRNADWSLLLEGGVSWSQSHSANSKRIYPLEGLVEGLAAQSGIDRATLLADNRVAGGNGTTFGYRFAARAERRLDDHWVFGGAFGWQHSPDYAPSQLQLTCATASIPGRARCRWAPIRCSPTASSSERGVKSANNGRAWHPAAWVIIWPITREDTR